MELSKKSYLTNFNFNAVDLAKFVFSIMVIMLHIPVLESEKGNILMDQLDFFYMSYLGRHAVPFFFVTSGFLLFRYSTEDNLSIIRVKRYISRIFTLYIIWSVIYLPFNLKEILQDSLGMRHGVICYIRDFIFTGSFLQLWYLNALILGVGLTAYLLWKKISIYRILIISGILYCMGLLGQTWYGLIRPLEFLLPDVWNVCDLAGKIIVTTRNGLFFAFFYVSIGAAIALKEIRIHPKYVQKMFIISGLLNLVEIYTLQHLNLIKDQSYSLFLCPTTVFLFLWIVQIKLPDWKGYIILRKMSSLIFFTHMLFYILVLKLLSVCGFMDLSVTSIFFITLFFTLTGSMVIIKLSELPYFRWLKMLT